MFHVSGQIDIMCEEFRIISEKIRLHISFNFTLKMLIERHKRVISFADNIEKFVSSMALMQIVLNTIVISYAGFVGIIVSVIE